MIDLFTEYKKFYGHQKVREYFFACFNNNRVHHAWLLSGNEGIGKFSLALNFAKVLLTNEANADFSFPNSRHDIEKINAGTHPDFLLLDSASSEEVQKKNPTITVDEIRKVTQFLHLTTSKSKYKVVVINGAEHMNISASNALLKTLEEPTPYSIIFLISQSLYEISPTIRSRCQILQLKPLSEEDFNNAIKDLDMDLQNNSYSKLYQTSKGSLGTALEILNNQALDLLPIIEQAVRNNTNSIIQLSEIIKAEPHKWRIIKYLLLDAMHQHAVNESQRNINNGLEILDKIKSIQNKLHQADIFNLDKQYLLLSILS